MGGGGFNEIPLPLRISCHILCRGEEGAREREESDWWREPKCIILILRARRESGARARRESGARCRLRVDVRRRERKKDVHMQHSEREREALMSKYKYSRATKL